MTARATVFSQLQGVVHDSQHRPLPHAHVVLVSAHSAFSQTAESNGEGAFAFTNIPLGDYVVTIAHSGFETLKQTIVVHSDTSPVLHFELEVGHVSETVTVTAPPQTASVDTVTPTTLIDRLDIATTPGADRSNSMAMITDYVPGAYMTHDMLHMRGGHQVSWLLDGVEIPNTNIASNVAAQIDPKDIDYLEVQRGSYTADVGDRTYGAFNVVPRTGFERDREAELVVSAGNFLQTNDQLSFGDHTQKFAWYTSLSGNRTDYGLAPPIETVRHDAADGYGGFASLIYNRTPKDQLRLITQLRHDFFQIPYDPNSAGDPEADTSGLRDTQNETDGVAAFTYAHTFNPAAMLQVSPFYHYNRADYDSLPGELQIASTLHRTSNFSGGQLTVNVQPSHGFFAHNTLQGGVYAFGQHDGYFFGAIFNDGSGTTIHEPASTSGSVIEEYLSDTFKPTSWLTLTAGLRQSRFEGQVTEDYTAPRTGIALQIPRLNWVFRAFYGRFYQPPPLLTASGPVLAYANSNNTAIAKLYGERDEEHQFGVQIPFRGWMLDVDTFKNRVNNFLDHSNIGESSLYFPVTVDGALVRAWEVSLRSPRLAHLGQAHLAYSNQIAEQRGAITGGLICIPVGDPSCDAGFNYTPVDHDQRNTLNFGFNASLPHAFTASTNVYYGSGFINGGFDPAGGPPADPRYPNQYLPAHTTFDLTVGKSIGDNLSASITAINVANRRVLLDNSLTFGGFHYNDPRQIYGELRYRFKF
ncbi:MAG TPA: TonB-dependent receptor [Acidobacteriaceae bacterium]|nr:TonB-dependent receptor [Acidobacteriaceae bacterium]